MPIRMTIEHTGNSFRREVLIERVDGISDPPAVNTYRASLVGRIHGRDYTDPSVTFTHRYGDPVTKLAERALQAMSGANTDPGPLTGHWGVRRGAAAIEEQLTMLGVDPNERHEPDQSSTAELVARAVLVAVSR